VQGFTRRVVGLVGGENRQDGGYVRETHQKDQESLKKSSPAVVVRVHEFVREHVFHVRSG
jgi:hypothetical protein